MTEQELLSKINVLSEEQYNTAKANGTLNENELYFTPEESQLLKNNFIKLAWENPNPSVAFGTGSIELDSADYDFLIWIFKEHITTGPRTLSVLTPKGFPPMFSLGSDFGVSGTYYVANYVRRFSRESDIKFTSDQPFVKYNGTSTSGTNNYLIPLYVYRVKKSATISSSTQGKNVISAFFENFLPNNSLKAVTGLTIGSQAGDQLTLTNSGVKIGKNVSKVLISGWAFNNQNEANLGLVSGVIKNGSVVDKTTNWQQSHSSNDNITMNVSPMLVEVAEDDVINIALEINKTNNTYKFSRGGVTVEVID